jgi:hypothetical protein
MAANFPPSIPNFEPPQVLSKAALHQIRLSPVENQNEISSNIILQVLNVPPSGISQSNGAKTHKIQLSDGIYWETLIVLNNAKKIFEIERLGINDLVNCKILKTDKTPVLVLVDYAIIFRGYPTLIGMPAPERENYCRNYENVSVAINWALKTESVKTEPHGNLTTVKTETFEGMDMESLPAAKTKDRIYEPMTQPSSQSNFTQSTRMLAEPKPEEPTRPKIHTQHTAIFPLPKPNLAGLPNPVSLPSLLRPSHSANKISNSRADTIAKTLATGIKNRYQKSRTDMCDDDSYIPIKCLTLHTSSWVIKGRIIKLGKLRTYYKNEKEGHVLNLVMMDANGDQIQGTCWGDEAKKNSVILIEKSIYAFSGGNLVPKSQYNKTINLIEISFNFCSDIRLLPEDDSVDLDTWDFVKISDVRALAINDCVDIMVYVESLGMPVNVMLKCGVTRQRRSVLVSDESGYMVELVLWGNYEDLRGSEFIVKDDIIIGTLPFQ